MSIVSRQLSRLKNLRRPAWILTIAFVSTVQIVYGHELLPAGDPAADCVKTTTKPRDQDGILKNMLCIAKQRVLLDPGFYQENVLKNALGGERVTTVRSLPLEKVWDIRQLNAVAGNGKFWLDVKSKAADDGSTTIQSSLLAFDAGYENHLTADAVIQVLGKGYKTAPVLPDNGDIRNQPAPVSQKMNIDRGNQIILYSFPDSKSRADIGIITNKDGTVNHINLYESRVN